MIYFISFIVIFFLILLFYNFLKKESKFYYIKAITAYILAIIAIALLIFRTSELYFGFSLNDNTQQKITNVELINNSNLKLNYQLFAIDTNLNINRIYHKLFDIANLNNLLQRIELKTQKRFFINTKIASNQQLIILYEKQNQKYGINLTPNNSRQLIYTTDLKKSDFFYNLKYKFEIEFIILNISIMLIIIFLLKNLPKNLTMKIILLIFLLLLLIFSSYNLYIFARIIGKI